MERCAQCRGLFDRNGRITLVEFEIFRGREAIYVERGFVASVVLLSVTSSENAPAFIEFTLDIRNVHLSRIPQQSTASGELKDLVVGSVALDRDGEIITASGYIVWTLIFDETLIAEIERHLLLHGADPYRVCRTVLDHRSRRRTH
jgi:hypothetical protein